MKENISSIILGCFIMGLGVSIFFDPQIYIAFHIPISLRPFHTVILIVSIFLGLYLILSNIMKLLNK